MNRSIMGIVGGALFLAGSISLIVILTRAADRIVKSAERREAERKASVTDTENVQVNPETTTSEN